MVFSQIYLDPNLEDHAMPVHTVCMLHVLNKDRLLDATDFTARGFDFQLLFQIGLYSRSAFICNNTVD